MPLPLEWSSNSDHGTWHITLSSLENLAALEQKWIELQSRTACSFFQSWGWVGSWIRALPSRLRPRALEVRLDDRLVGLAVLGNKKIWRYGVIPSNALLVTETGDDQRDRLTVEHNGFLVESGLSGAVVREGISALVNMRLPWDEMFVSGIVQDRLPDYLDGAQRAHLCPLIKIEKPYYYVDCDMIRESGGDYLGKLGRNTRSQIRRAMRAYEEQGPLSFHVADTLERAQRFFESLRRAHQQYWVSKGQPGAFGSEFALDFHQNMIRNQFSKGEIQLAEICAGTATIGFLYNFVFNRVVYNYQSAFQYSDDARLKPGLVSHCRAVQYNVDADMKTYDLLMGTQRFKENLATHEGKMAWLVLQKSRIRFRLEQVAIRWRRQLRGTRASTEPSRTTPEHTE
jgi:CelD/BcsL family acetyltransferase involved in cellulose biosynthesis